MVLGICGFACCVLWIMALVFGYRARREIAASMGGQSGTGMATAGIVLGWVWAVLTALYFVLTIALRSSS
jgi:preprotein translocase subunit SecG